MTPPEEDILDSPKQEQEPQTPEAISEEETSEEETPKMSLEVKIEKPNDCQRHVTVTISREDIDRYFNDAFNELMPKANVPGFRAGRAPRKLVENRFRHEVSDQVKGSLLMDSMAQISEEQDFSAISEPDFNFDAVEVPKDGPMSFEFDLEVRPEFDLPEWQGLKIDKPVRDFTKKDVDRQLKILLRRHGQLVSHDEAAKMDDYLTLDITVEHDGKTISKVEEETVCLKPTLSFPDGKIETFGKKLIGAKPGDKVEITVTISSGADNENVRGEEVVAHFTVRNVQQLELPELDEEFLDQLGGFDSEGDLRDAIQSELERQLNYHQQQRVRQQITAELTKKADWDLPTEMLQRQSNRELERAVMELRSSGFSEDQIQAHENELRRNSMGTTATALKEHFILERIAEEESIEAAEEDFEKEIMLIAMQSNDSPRRVRARLEKRGLMDVLLNQIVERKVIEQITSQAKFKEVEFKPEENETEAIAHMLAGAGQAEIPEAKHGGDAEKRREPVDRT